MKYAPLQDYLLSLSEREWNASFSDVERVLGFQLPKSARKYPAWWANEAVGTHSHAKSWQEVGWKTENLDIGSERVTFCRDRSL